MGRSGAVRAGTVRFLRALVQLTRNDFSLFLCSFSYQLPHFLLLARGAHHPEPARRATGPAHGSGPGRAGTAHPPARLRQPRGQGAAGLPGRGRAGPGARALALARGRVSIGRRCCRFPRTAGTDGPSGAASRPRPAAGQTGRRGAAAAAAGADARQLLRAPSRRRAFRFTLRRWWQRRRAFLPWRRAQCGRRCTRRGAAQHRKELRRPRTRAVPAGAAAAIVARGRCDLCDCVPTRQRWRCHCRGNHLTLVVAHLLPLEQADVAAGRHAPGSGGRWWWRRILGSDHPPLLRGLYPRAARVLLACAALRRTCRGVLREEKGARCEGRQGCRCKHRSVGSTPGPTATAAIRVRFCPRR